MRAVRPNVKSRVSGVSTPVDVESPVSDQEDEGLEFDENNDSEDDSGSEFEAEDDEDEVQPETSKVKTSLSSKAAKSKPRTRRRAKSMDSENLDDEEDEEVNASEDEALMMEAAIHASLAPKDVDENGAGPSSSRPTAGNSRTKAAALRAAAAERRLGIQKADDADDFVLDDDDESYASSDASDDSEGESKKAKGGKAEKKTGTMTLSELRAERRAIKEANRKEMAPVHAAIRKKVKELKRKLTHVRAVFVQLELIY